MLFVRGPISTRRGSAIAGIACGLPVVAERGAETAGPIEEAGVVLVSADKPGEFNEALLRVLTDQDYRAQLAERSRLAQEKYFSWQAIAARYAEELKGTR
jgi:glycosyltransferase involved in cell wall biosynthesis